eukprot:TRINITY_DN4546_c0_g1_i5.p1 TRINITY_DN4546_c0_g1~~TRINITY_DN4546_c0_g1_i5.p1  ORF type:complete len:107 (-),score=5.42 TRINITY_DN4546_c0_g1_i5:13-333(-)
MLATASPKTTPLHRCNTSPCIYRTCGSFLCPPLHPDHQLLVKSVTYSAVRCTCHRRCHRRYVQRQARYASERHQVTPCAPQEHRITLVRAWHGTWWPSATLRSCGG